MICQKVEAYTYDEQGKRHVVAELQASEEPATMPTTGEGIGGMDPLTENDILSPGTTLLVTKTSQVFMMNEDNEFDEL